MAESPWAMYQACLLHARADRALRLLVSKELEAFGLSMMEWLLLGVICSGPRIGLNMGAAAQALDVTMPHVTSLMNNLVFAKLVRQKTVESDRRSRRLLTTPKGKALLGKIEEAIAEGMRQHVAGIPREQLKQYMKTIKQLANAGGTINDEH